jgi:hypothetical protein
MWPHPDGTLVIAPARQRRKAFLDEHFAHRGGAQRRSLLLERLADLVDRIVALAQRHDLLMGTALLGLLTRPGPRAGEEVRQIAAAKRVAEHAEGAGRVAEPARRLGRSQPFREEGAQGLVLALPRRRGLSEEAPAIC